MIGRLVIAVVVAVIVTLACLLLGTILDTLHVPIATTVGHFLLQWGYVIGVLAGLFQFFNPARRHPDPLFTTIGHEPPLAVAAREGWSVITERPEHLACNLQKGVQDDAMLSRFVA
jgi:hypothetical protein